MKKAITIILSMFLMVLMLSSSLAAGGTEQPNKSPSIKFTDVPDSAWYASQVYQLAEKGILCGVGNNQFKPGNNITVAECLKVIVMAMGHTDIKSSESGFWADTFILKAKELGVIKEGEYSASTVNTYAKPATRPELAMFISRAMMAKGETFVSNYKDYANSILDYRNIPAMYQDDVLKAYSKGVMTGYPDKTFGYKDNIKRSEISALVIRFMDESQRTKMPEPEVNKDNNEEYDYVNDTYYKSFSKLYSDKTKTTTDSSVLMYSGSGAPDYFTDNYSFCMIKSDSAKTSYCVNITTKFTDADKPALKDLFKLFFPTSYETVYSETISLQGLPGTDQYKNYKGNLDGWDLSITKLKAGVIIALTK